MVGKAFLRRTYLLKRRKSHHSSTVLPRTASSVPEQSFTINTFKELSAEENGPSDICLRGYYRKHRSEKQVGWCVVGLRDGTVRKQDAKTMVFKKPVSSFLPGLHKTTEEVIGIWRFGSRDGSYPAFMFHTPKSRANILQD